MNAVNLIGRLTNDPSVHNNGDVKVANYTLAVSRRGKKDEADFIRCATFGKNADFAEKYLTKGMKIAVEGSIQTGSYKDKDGRTVYTTTVVVNNHEFVESRQQSQQAQPQYPAQPPQRQAQQTPPQNYQQTQRQAQPQQQMSFDDAVQRQYQQMQQSFYNDGFMSIPESADDKGLPFN